MEVMKNNVGNIASFMVKVEMQWSKTKTVEANEAKTKASIMH